MTPADPAPTRLTVDEYERLAEEGLLDADDRVELLEGVVVTMPPGSPRHAGVIDRLNELLVGLARGRAVVRVQNAFRAGRWSMPQPDLAVVPGRHGDWDARHPDRAHLVVEVSVTSLPSDRISKSRIYAAAGVPQYLIVNVPGGCIEVFEEPVPATARYRRTRVATRGDAVALVELPGAVLHVDDVLPPPDADA